MEPFRTVTITAPYGPLQVNFTYDLRSGYTALIGPNNAGKSALLQAIFRTLVGDESAAGPGGVALIFPDRQFVDPTTQTGGATLASWNSGLVQQLGGEPIPYGTTPPGPNRHELARVLMHGSFVVQNLEMNDLLLRLGLGRFDLRDAQQIVFDDDVPIFVQGTGLRSTYPIVAALTNPNVRVVLIDEPELSLEPRLQKVLRDVLVEASEEKIIVVATHSHLFVRRDVPEANQIVRRVGPRLTEVHTVTDKSELYDVVFDLLGSSTEDLFFPGNYIIVEGASDQAIVERVLELLGAPPPTVKVLAARGIDAMRDAVEAVYRASVPLVVSDSPYKGRVVALIDDPKDKTNANFVKLEQALRDRLHILDTPSIEECMPESVYAKAGRSRATDLADIDAAKNDWASLRVLKAEISTALAAALEQEDLDPLPTIVEAAKQAIEAAT